MSKMNLTPGTKKFRLLVLMAQNGIMKYSEIQRCICEMSGKDYDEMDTQKKYQKSRGPYSTYPWDVVGTKQVRAHRGIWATNLSSGRDPILRNYCERVYKNGKLQGWAVKPTVIEAINKLTQTPKSSLEQDFKSDEIPNNSKVVERRVIQILDTNTNKIGVWMPKASTVDKILKDLNPTREDILTASRLAATVNPLVALQESHEILKAEFKKLSDERARIEQRMVDIKLEQNKIKQQVAAFFE